MTRVMLFALGLAVVGATALRAEDPKPIKVLFLGDKGHHEPEARFKQLQPVLEKRGIDMTYTDKVESLSAKVLANYDGLVIYANTEKIAPEQEKALLDFVEGGKGFIPLHCASYCFLNSEKYIDLVGAQFKSHNTGTFRTTIAEPDHPIMKGFKGFESYDETYVHTKHNEKNRTVLEYREEGGKKEPWTWVRTQGKGRVFYTAWGHDQRTWGNPGFQELVERGIRWAVGKDPTSGPPFERTDAPFPIPEMTTIPKDVKPFEYIDVGKKIPNYQPRGGQGTPLSQMQLPLPPEESIKHLVMPKGFHAELFVSEENLGGKPICMTWDERGRLWVAVTVDYPNNLQPPDQGHDKIVVCEDTKGTGKADKFTVFAEKLSIPTSMMFARGGLIVFEATRTIFLKDTKGSGQADVREVLFGTWGMGDTHGGPSNMQYGLDNWVWGMQGYNYSRLKVGDETVAFRQGFFRFKPPHPTLSPEGRGSQNGPLAPGGRGQGEGLAVSKLEFLRSTDNNTWGLGMSEEGIIFGSTANGNPSVYMPIPNRYYEAVRGWAPSLVLKTIADTYKFHPITTKVRQVDWHGGYTAGAGHSLYTARNYPQEYWNRTAFVNEPTGHLTGTFILKRDGSDFHSTNPFNLVASDDEWTSPIMAEVGPDGNVWVIDWYAFIVQHNPTPNGFTTGKGAAYESELRDKKHGRIYRIVYDGVGERHGVSPPVTLADATPQKLVETLKNDNLFWRRHAQRLLVERGKRDVLPALFELVRDNNVDAIGLNVAAIHALWSMHGLGALDGSDADATAVAVAALKHKSSGVRRNAVQVLPRDKKSVAAILDAGLTQDPDAQVRLLTLLALADRPPTPEAGNAVAVMLARPENADDRWIPDAATCAAANNSESFLKAVSARKLANEKILAVTGIVAEHYARGGPVDSVTTVVASLADADPQVAGVVVRGLTKGWPSDKKPKLDEASEKDLGRLLNSLAPAQRGALVKLASAWGSKNLEKYGAEAVRSLLAKVQDDKLKTTERLDAARELVGYKVTDKPTVQAMLDLVSVNTPPEVATGLLDALRASEASETGKLILDHLSGLTPSIRAAGLSVVLSRPEWVRALLDSADKGKVQLTELSLDQRQTLALHPNRAIRDKALALLKRGGSLPNPDREKVLQEFLPITKEEGDAVAGKLVFKNVCAKCHVHGGEGTRVGPDLTGMAVHPKDHLLTDILDPSRSVEANYRAYQVTLKKGTTLTGLLASESKTAIEIYDAEGKKQTILRSDIDTLEQSTKSLMPDGFEKQLTKKELTDLLEFLTARGKYLPLPLEKAATVVSTRGMFNSEDSLAERMVLDDWSPRTFKDVPFNLIDPRGDRAPNVILLNGPQGQIPPKMPKSVTVPCNAAAKAIHLLSGVSGWGSPGGDKSSVTLIVRLHYDDGKTEDHKLKNGEHFADYIRRVDVPGSEFAFSFKGRQQMRYLAVTPERPGKIKEIEFVKGDDRTAPVIMAVTIEAVK